jgi:polysaccharide pyruvyl transferase WcaK-like protein
LASLGAHLLETGYDLVLYATTRSDHDAVLDVRSEIAARVKMELLQRITSPPVRTVEDLRNALSPVDVAVASRLHGTLLPHVWGIPVVALSYERKVATLMTAMNCAAYCIDIDAFDPMVAAAKVQELLAARADLSRAITGMVAALRRQVEAQYDLVFGPLQPGH